jgi:hypothetical protein
MADLYNQSFCSTMDLLARNMGLALSICQRGTHAAGNAQSAVRIATDCSRLIERVADTYAQYSHVSAPTHIYPNPMYPPIERPDDDDDVIQKAIARAMCVDNDSDDDTETGAVPYALGRTSTRVDLSEPPSANTDYPDSDSDSDSDSSSTLDLDTLPEGQRLNYLKTKGMEQAIRDAQFHDTSEEAKAHRAALGVVEGVAGQSPFLGGN